MRVALFAAPLLAILAVAPASPAHELRPAYLELREVAPGELAVLWKTPMRGPLRLDLAPRISGRTERLGPVVTRESGGAAIQTWRLRTGDSLRGRTVRIEGLEATVTDALVRAEFADGATWLRRLTPQEPEAVVPARSPWTSVAGEYLELGVEHILLGVDHLLFVLALLLVARGARRLVAAVTAFTAAHSITLALAALGLVHLPPPPVEALIALSIALVAAEAVRRRSGRETATARAPWRVAFAFGLLHGLGFAGALTEIGLPEGHIPLALLFFNLGVETGQILFVAAVMASAALLRPARLSWPRWAPLLPPYAIGGLAMFWVIERVSAF